MERVRLGGIRGHGEWEKVMTEWRKERGKRDDVCGGKNRCTSGRLQERKWPWAGALFWGGLPPQGSQKSRQWRLCQTSKWHPAGPSMQAEAANENSAQATVTCLRCASDHADAILGATEALWRRDRHGDAPSEEQYSRDKVPVWLCHVFLSSWLRHTEGYNHQRSHAGPWKKLCCSLIRRRAQEMTSWPHVYQQAQRLQN